MIYFQKAFTIVKRTYTWGSLLGVELGSQGRGRHQEFIPVPVQYPEGHVLTGMQNDLEIGTTKSGRPKIVQTQTETDDIYIVFDSYGGYTRRGDGHLTIFEFRDGLWQHLKQNLLVEANGADGDAGRIGTWQCGIVKYDPDLLYRVRLSGGFEQGDRSFILETQDQGQLVLSHASKEEVYAACDADVRGNASRIVQFYEQK